MRTLPRRAGRGSAYMLARAHRRLVITLRSAAKDTLLVALGILSAAFGLNGFLLANQFIDGGATGISLLLSAVTGMPLGLFILCVNVPFIILGSNVIGRQFAIKTSLAITGLVVVLSTVTFPEVTHDKLLVAAFGGLFLGAGIGLSVRGGAVLDGTEVLAIFLSRKLGVTIGDVIMVINIFIFGAAAYLLNVETALYSMITYLAASKTLDFVVEGFDEYIGVTIVSAHSDEIRSMITEAMGRGVTVYNGKRGYGKRGEIKEVDIVYSVITRLELNRIRTEVEKIDPNAFVVVTSVKDTHGGMVKKRPLSL